MCSTHDTDTIQDYCLLLLTYDVNLLRNRIIKEDEAFPETEIM